MERQFDQELIKLKENLYKMASLTEETIAKSIKALAERDESMANDIINDDDIIDLLELDINNHCLRLLALKQPMAIDLRLITSAMKICGYLERIADQTVNISQRTLELAKQPLLKPLIDIPRMANIAQQMVIVSINGLINNDSTQLKKLYKQDDVVDNLNEQIFRELLTYMIEDPRTIKRAVSLILVGRHLERIGDLALNIAEEVFYIIEGKSIKHAESKDLSS